MSDPDRAVFDQLRGLTTEAVNPRSRDLDALTTRQVLETIHAEDLGVAAAVGAVLDEVERGVERVVGALESGGRLIYVGAGTSGRLGVLDAAECPPTFGTDPAMVVGVIAGGPEALIRSAEGVEDQLVAGGEDLAAMAVSAADCVCGIAASSRTPYVQAALAYARSQGASTLLVTCNAPPRPPIADVVIAPQTGPEVVMGSTRMKAGTATKLVLNMLTTAAMVRLGKVHGNLMVDLKATSQKLTERSKRVLMMVTGLDYAAAAALLKLAGGHVKTAIVMHQAELSPEAARARLAATGGSVRAALAG